MPCYDKKLESVRPQLSFVSTNASVENEETRANYDNREVDCVLTTAELQQFIDEICPDFQTLEESSLDRYSIFDTQNGETLFRPMDSSASGGYGDNVFRYAAKELFGIEVSDIEWTIGKNADWREASLIVDGTKRLRFAHAYGFRNIQNIMRLIKTKRCQFDYVEVMACPSGCVNGGGQIKSKTKDLTTQRQLVDSVREVYMNGFSAKKEREGLDNDTQEDEQKVSRNHDQTIMKILSESVWMHKWTAKKEFDLAKKDILHTTFTAMDKNEGNPLTMKW